MLNRLFATALLALSCYGVAQAQGRPDTAAIQASQREAMAALAYMDGTWRGTAWTMLPSGEKHTVTHTERIGPFLGGTLKVIEGKSYETTDARVGFNAFAIISFDPAKRQYTMHSYAQGFSGDFELTLTPDGYIWNLPAGPGATLRYTATLKNGTWVEVGDRMVAGKEPMRIFEMTLKRFGDTDWPAAGSVLPK